MTKKTFVEASPVRSTSNPFADTRWVKRALKSGSRWKNTYQKITELHVIDPITIEKSYNAYVTANEKCPNSRKISSITCSPTTTRMNASLVPFHIVDTYRTGQDAAIHGEVLTFHNCFLMNTACNEAPSMTGSPSPKIQKEEQKRKRLWRRKNKKCDLWEKEKSVEKTVVMLVKDSKL